jgi:hypothetical protein
VQIKCGDQLSSDDRYARLLRALGGVQLLILAARKREVGEQLWKALVEDGSIVATGFVAET